ncbi:MAG: hypothetical protein COT24_01040 [Candidatus Kerfeldbacteria bacterium CG08_land_8_20_14_0_20_40_16]|uniref:Pentapeptide repeat-containing protein n=1 Tax=Candidatus Kerfeldbacteria bacterium CG08_land_8_20_14_0_20_40_16 TaxID=2014244 RepID=A0A2H0YWP4_9BACT|nr:MAG: hypothetical protein COT24_01040 [Candidatus Kerfeldbacteria bacterium CG08_land_8_20_14_0_20_40_16]
MVSMEKFNNDFKLPEQEIKKQHRLTREEVAGRLEQGENLENLILTDLDLAGLNLEGRKFCHSDLRGINFYRAEENDNGTVTETRTNLKGCDFTEAIIADLGPEAFFYKVEAEGAKFGYQENLISRRKRQAESGKVPRKEDTGGLFGFNGMEGNFKKTRWINADFGGGSGYDALFIGADLSEATMEGCDLSGIDFSEVNIDNIEIVNPTSLAGMKINKDQIELLAQTIRLSDSEKRAKFLKEIEQKGPRKALEDYFKIIIIKGKE